MSGQSYRVKIASVRMLAPEVSELTLTVVDPPVLTFQPGQAVAIAVPTSHAKVPIRRYYSLTSPPSSSNRVCLLFDRGEQGIGSEFLRNQSVGQECDGLRFPILQYGGNHGADRGDAGPRRYKQQFPIRIIL